MIGKIFGSRKGRKEHKGIKGRGKDSNIENNENRFADIETQEGGADGHKPKYELLFFFSCKT